MYRHPQRAKIIAANSATGSGNETAALLNTFAIFAAAFFMRPSAGSCSDHSATGLLLAAPLGLVGLYIRLRLDDTRSSPS